jgi:hypothetical protein
MADEACLDTVQTEDAASDRPVHACCSKGEVAPAQSKIEAPWLMEQTVAL